ncbi:MAG: DUF5715 family protein [Bacteroidales bacterium]|nr:DUF5715 family protein [Bacteroidales bacterium]
MKSLIATILPAILLSACSDDGPVGVPDRRLAASAAEILADKPGPNPYDSHLDSAPDDRCVRLRVAQIGPLRRAFNDSNYIHLETARALGIKPITGDADIWRLSRPVVKIESCPEYFVDELTHSYPYLVPEAAGLLSEIGRNFNDSLAARGGGHYRIKVTSVLRTPVTVKRLRRVNRNAVEESTHSFGTTFDISYSKFICDSDEAPHRTFEDLKNLLGEILYDLRANGRCWVKYEARQSCFHITARQPRAADNTIDS